MDRQPLRVAVMTPENRVGTWVAGRGRQRGGLEVSVIDLDPAGSPGPALTARLADAEAFVLVTPEDEVPEVLRQAIGHRRVEWRAKPVAFVRYPSGAGGGRAVEQLRAVFVGLHVVIVGPGAAAFDAAGTTAMFEQLEWWGRALRDPSQLIKRRMS